MTTGLEPTHMLRPFRAERRNTVSLLLGVAVLLPFLTSLAAAGFAVSELRSQSGVTAAAANAYEVRRRSQTLLALVLDLQSSQRGYVLTGNAEYLAPYDAARRELPLRLRELAALVVGNPPQAALVAELDALATARAAFAAEVVALVAGGRRDDALAAVESGRGKRLTDEARTLIGRIDTEEALEVVRAQEALVATARRQTQALSALVIASAVALVALLVILRRLAAFEEVVRMCAWSRTIEYQGQWMSFETYLQERFGLRTSHGISPEAARRVRHESDRENSVREAGLVEPRR